MKNACELAKLAKPLQELTYPEWLRLRECIDRAFSMHQLSPAATQEAARRIGRHARQRAQAPGRQAELNRLSQMVYGCDFAQSRGMSEAERWRMMDTWIDKTFGGQAHEQGIRRKATPIT